MLTILTTTLFTIDIFNISNFTIVQYSDNIFNYIIGLIMVSSLFSGTTWFINNIVNFLDKGD
jgi:hypothetical protein